MLKNSLLGSVWRWGLALSLIPSVSFWSNGVFAQVQSDTTLGRENSIINSIDSLNQRVDGGAVRGTNLFHSFQEFSIGEGRGVYFANPDGITDILSRVTGNNPSNILGKLGVLGGANLYFINPNGIVFGENASLDIQGSFVATTADGIRFGEQGNFSATQPQQSSLLSIAPGALFFNQVASQSGNIVNRGNLEVGKDLTLAGNNLNLQGQLFAGGNLNLQATDTVRVRDSIDNPFIAAAKGQFLLQGNQNVDIFALSHPDSGLFSRGNMILRSANQVGGDAKYWSGGNFRIEQLDGSLGNLFSPYDPIIRSLGDVSFNNYLGASLHIFAGGSVTVPGSIVITRPETGVSGENFIAENVTLSNGTILPIDGSAKPTLDIRAGIGANQVGVPTIPVNDFPNNQFFSRFVEVSGFPFPLLENPVSSNTATNADIKIGSIRMLTENAANGTVFLSNQYKPNTVLPGGNIEVGTIRTDDINGQFLGNGGSIILDGRSNITLTSQIRTDSASGNSGDITLLANGDISLRNNTSLITSTRGTGSGGNIFIQANGLVSLSGSNAALISNLNSNATGKGGNITVSANSIYLRDGALIDASTFGQGNAGQISINADEIVSLESNSSIFNNIEEKAVGNTTGISIKAKNVALSGDSVIFANSSGKGNTGNIIIKADNSISLKNNSSIASVTIQDAEGNSGNIDILAKTLSLNNQSRIVAISEGQGDTGNIFIKADDSISLSGNNNLFTFVPTTAIANNLGNTGIGKTGNITILTGSLSLNGAFISNSTFGRGNTGKISIETDNDISLTNSAAIFGSINSGAVGNGDEIKINAELLSVDSSVIQTIVRGASGNLDPGRGKSGNININLSGDLKITGNNTDVVQGIITSVANGAEGKAGNIKITAGDFSIAARNAQVRSTLDTSAIGEAGNIDVKVRNLKIAKEAAITTVTGGEGNAGNIFVEATDNVKLSGNSVISSGVVQGGNGNSGNISLKAASLSITSGSQLLSSVGIPVVKGTENLQAALGNAGNIDINISKEAVFDGRDKNGVTSGILSSTRSEVGGKGGNITIKAGSILINNGARLTSETASASKAGDIEVTTPFLDIKNGGQINARAFRNGNAGNININVDNLLNMKTGDISTVSTQSSGGNIQVKAGNIRLFEDSDITTFVRAGTGSGGNINLTANTILALEDSDIFSFSGNGKGGDITFNTAGFFSQPLFRPTPPTTDANALFALDGNSRVDVNASGAVSGAITGVPNITFIEESLTDLPNNQIDPNTLIANSCINRTANQNSTFFITGKGGIPIRPDDASLPNYSTGSIRSLSTANSRRPWKIGDPVVEPTGVYKLPNGKLILSRECS
ncbi:MAG: filamentous hemagglutinin N-terminal domain-containing protein [Calothrix sp. MO_192.B10]|nr:filamentous hemagglutinin N-terminal domain-containing protein [Calothrix sp. MO_192.B10]